MSTIGILFLDNSLICPLFTSTISADANFIVNKKPINIIQNLINIIFYVPKKYYWIKYESRGFLIKPSRNLI